MNKHALWNAIESRLPQWEEKWKDAVAALEERKAGRAWSDDEVFKGLMEGNDAGGPGIAETHIVSGCDINGRSGLTVFSSRAAAYDAPPETGRRCPRPTDVSQPIPIPGQDGR